MDNRESVFCLVTNTMFFVRLTKKLSYLKRFLQPIIQCACKLFHVKYTDQINQLGLIKKYNKKKKHLVSHSLLIISLFLEWHTENQFHMLPINLCLVGGR